MDSIKTFEIQKPITMESQTFKSSWDENSFEWLFWSFTNIIVVANQLKATVTWFR